MDGTTERTALVLGATGGAGGEIAAALLHRGWTVRALARDPAAAAARWRIAGGRPEWRAGDAMDAASVQAAASRRRSRPCGQSAGLPQLGQLVAPMLANTIAAAEREGRADRAAGHSL